MFNCFWYLFIVMKLINVFIILEKFMIELIYFFLFFFVVVDNIVEN